MHGLESLLETVDLEVMAEGVRAGTHSEGRGREFQIVEAATLKLWVPNEVKTWRTN